MRRVSIVGQADAPGLIIQDADTGEQIHNVVGVQITIEGRTDPIADLQIRKPEDDKGNPAITSFQRVSIHSMRMWK